MVQLGTILERVHGEPRDLAKHRDGNHFDPKSLLEGRQIFRHFATVGIVAAGDALLARGHHLDRIPGAHHGRELFVEFVIRAIRVVLGTVAEIQQAHTQVALVVVHVQHRGRLGRGRVQQTQMAHGDAGVEGHIFVVRQLGHELFNVHFVARTLRVFGIVELDEAIFVLDDAREDLLAVLREKDRAHGEEAAGPAQIGVGKGVGIMEGALAHDG